jgi:hypothetical protein
MAARPEPDGQPVESSHLEHLPIILHRLASSVGKLTDTFEHVATVSGESRSIPMTANSVLAHLFRARPNTAQAAAALVDSEQPMRLAPTLTADDLPAGFEEILEVQVLGYRERLTSLHGGGRQRVLDPVWTLIPKV